MSEPPAKVHWGKSKRMIRKTAKNHHYCFDDVVVSTEENSLLHSWGLYHRIATEGCFWKHYFAFRSIVRLPCLLSRCVSPCWSVGLAEAVGVSVVNCPCRLLCKTLECQFMAKSCVERRGILELCLCVSISRFPSTVALTSSGEFPR